MPRFLADCNVGRLARWLRVLGYDAAYEPALPDAQVVARALAERRVLLTRDADMMQRRAISGGGRQAILLRRGRRGGPGRPGLKRPAREPPPQRSPCIGLH